MPLDSFDKKILRVLGEGKGSPSKTLSEIVHATGFARSTVILHIKLLESRGYLKRLKIASKRRGRPKYAYSPPLKAPAARQVQPSQEPQDRVTILFPKLRQACKYEKGHFCKLAKKHC